MKPDYTKIILISIPITFIFWIVCFIGLAATTHNRDLTTYASLTLTALFLILFIFLCIKYAKPLKCEVTEDTPQKNGFFIVLFVFALIAAVAVPGIFFNVPVEHIPKYITLIGVISTVVGVISRKRKNARGNSLKGGES